jgi:hypothetical protein
MSQKFNELVRCYLEHWPNVKERKIYQNGLLRAKIENGYLCSYNAEMLKITNSAIWINNHPYSLTSTRDRGAIYGILSGSEEYEYLRQKPIIIIDFEMLRHIPDSEFNDFLENAEIGDIVENKSTIYTYDNNDAYELTEGWYYTFRYKNRVFYAYMVYWPNRKSARNQFICELPSFWPRVLSVEEARKELRPQFFRQDWIEGKDYYRQGDLFFIPDSSLLYFSGKSRVRLYNGSGGISIMTLRTEAIKNLIIGRHIMTKALVQVEINDLANGAPEFERKCLLSVWARGCVRHPEHGRLKLGDGKKWYYVAKNRAVWSIGFGGKHD